MLLAGGRSFYSLRPREKMDVAWAYLMSLAPAMSNPHEFREKMIDLFYGEGALEQPGQIEYDEIAGKDGRMIRVPRPAKRDGPVTPPGEPVMPSLSSVPNSKIAGQAAKLKAFREQIENS
jgi:hypothetical protein